MKGMVNFSIHHQHNIPVGTVEQCQISTPEIIRNNMNVRVSNLVYMGERSTGLNFQEKVQTLKSLNELWNQGLKIKVIPQPIISEAIGKTGMSVSRKILLSLTQVLLSPNNITKEKLAELQEIENVWKASKNVKLEEKAFGDLGDKIEHAQVLITNDVLIPNKIIMRGKPRGADETFAGKRKAKKK